MAVTVYVCDLLAAVLVKPFLVRVQLSQHKSFHKERNGGKSFTAIFGDLNVFIERSDKCMRRIRGKRLRRVKTSSPLCGIKLLDQFGCLRLKSKVALNWS